MKNGYARVSIDEQDTALQLDALNASGCERIYSEHYTGKKSARSELERMLDALREGNTVVVWRLDCLG